MPEYYIKTRFTPLLFGKMGEIIIKRTIMIALILAVAGTASAQENSMERRVEVFSEIQQMLRGHGTLIITSDEEMEKLEHDPGMELKGFRNASLRNLANWLVGRDGRRVDVSYDFFFGGTERKYYSTSPQTIRTYKAMHDMAREHGMGFGASVLSPLDLGPAYYREKGRGGRTYQFQEGLLQADGSFKVPIRVQRQWFHNKGPVPLYVNSVRAFAFSEKKIGDTAYYTVNVDEILDVSENAELELDPEDMKKTPIGYSFARGTVSGRAENVEDRNRVLAVVVYEVEEMDYFHEDALPYITGALDKYKAAGVTFDTFYSDEMHIQFDWELGSHFGTDEINTRYITPGLIDAYAKRHGEQYRDFEKYLVYFAFAQHGFLNGDGEPEMAQHVFGESPSDIYATWKFRRDYFRLLTDHVVDLFVDAKRYAEKIFDRKRIWTRAHATWQESPTCDRVMAPWRPEDAPISQYDYTPAYEWSSSIRESMSACYDYFRWGDFLTGMGNDHAEGGYIDRNYFGGALAASFGAFNDVPYSYWGHWGAPAPVAQRVRDAAATYGIACHMPNFARVQGWQHRKTPVLALYPLDLNYVEERFGSWMVQYGYCDFLTEEKFVEMVEVLPDGRFRIKDREYTTLVVLFEPMVFKNTIKTIREIGNKGGKVLWTGPPAAIYHEDGSDALADWLKVFGLESVQEAWNGLKAKDAVIKFRSALADIPEFRVPTHLLVDRVYPARPTDGTEVVGVGPVKGDLSAVATLFATENGGSLVYMGARPRDDQSGSTPDAPRTLYHLLRAMGAYTDSGPGWAEQVSNTGELLVCESPNGAVSITHHYYMVEEKWGGGFFRPEGETFDESVLPPSRFDFNNRQFGPYKISYQGDRVVTFRMVGNNLAAFSGINTQGITINGREFNLTDTPAHIVFAPLPEEQLGEGIRKAWFLNTTHSGDKTGDILLRLPFVVSEGAQLVPDRLSNGRGVPVHADFTIEDGVTVLRIPQEMQAASIYLFVND